MNMSELEADLRSRLENAFPGAIVNVPSLPRSINFEEIEALLKKLQPNEHHHFAYSPIAFPGFIYVFTEPGACKRENCRLAPLRLLTIPAIEEILR